SILGPLSQTIFSGQTVLFRMTTVGTLPLRYQWRWGGQDIAGATNAFLQVRNVQTNEAGSYTLEVTDGLGALSSTTVALEVREAAPEIVTSPASQVAYAGQTVALRVTPTGSEPFFYQWRFRGVDLAGSTDPVLVLRGVTADQGGRYQAV